MVAFGTRPKGALFAPFGLCTLAFALLPAPIGTQDLAALFSYQPAAERQPLALASLFGTLHVATFRFPHPVGTAIPGPVGYRLASLDYEALDLTGLNRRSDAVQPSGGSQTSVIDRRLKDDSLISPVLTPAREAAPAPSAFAREAHAALTPGPDPERTIGSDLASGEMVPKDLNANVLPEDGVWPELGSAELSPSLNPTMDTTLLYFGAGALDASPHMLDRPESDLEPAIPMPARRPADAGAQIASLSNPGKGGETVAGKGEVTGNGRRPLSPAERLGLNGKGRAKSEKCLAEAVYFESRGESVRGQMAVAQVVMNRVFSEFYPDNVCDVVYQNAHRRLACQFTFACDGLREVVRDRDAWDRAKRIAKDTLDGKLWLEHIGKATHYHAYWVRPWWIRAMRKLHKVGAHTFYRPRRWGDGSDEPVWGDPKTTAALAKTL